MTDRITQPSQSARPARQADAASIGALRTGDRAALERLASDWHSAPEVLFFLSQSPNSRVRARIAANPSTPEMADELLLADDVAEVRACLGRKIAAKLPELTGPDADRLRDAAAAKLLALARDTEVHVRRALANAVATLDCIPKELALTLSRDIDALVSVPIVELSPMLDDDDLIALISEPPTALALSAMSRRAALSPDIVDRLVDTGQSDVLVSLLRNTATQIREATLDRLVHIAEHLEIIHEPLVARGELTDQLIVKLSRFVSATLIENLAARGGIGDQVREALDKRLQERIEPAAAIVDMPSEEEVADAIARQNDDEVFALLARRAAVCEDTVRRVFSIGLAKAIVALAWKARLSMSTAVQLQSYPGRIPRSRQMHAGSQDRYPISKDELEWHLSTLGIGQASREVGSARA